MLSCVLDCPHCNHRFGFDYDDQFPEQIVCPKCGEGSPYENYSTLIFCARCRAKLKIPLDLLSVETVACPQCGEELNLKSAIAGDMGGTTLTPGGGKVRNKKMLEDGAYIDKYRILHLLGKGGMAEVYLAEHLLLRQYCAIKVMRDNSSSADEVQIKRFVREAKLAHQLDHPNLVKVFDVGNDPKTGYMFLSMEYVEGRTLLDLCNERLFSEEELLEVAEVMADALNVLYKGSVVHRDIKPSNIMKTLDGQYKLMDLGIAKAGNSGGEMTLTMDRSTIGTPSYASPEQCQSAHNADIRSDIYCLGSTLYHLATGCLPFEGETAVEIILKVMQEKPVPIGSVRSDLSPRVIELIQCMMEKDPAHRPQTPEELREMIRGTRMIPKLRLVMLDEEHMPLPKMEENAADSKTIHCRETALPGESGFRKYLKKVLSVFSCDAGKLVVKKLIRGFIAVAALLVISCNLLYLQQFYRLEVPEYNSGKELTAAQKFYYFLLGKRVETQETAKNSQKKSFPQYSSFLLFPVITFESTFSPPESDFLPSMIREGALRMDGVYPEGPQDRNHPAYNYPNANSVAFRGLDPEMMAVSFDCRIHPENKGSLLVCGVDPPCMSLDLENGKLVFRFAGGEFIKTNLTLPQDQWFNLAFHCDQKNKRLRLLYERKFVGNYFLPGFRFPDSRFTFYHSGKRTAFRGDVDNLRVGHGRFSAIYRSFMMPTFSAGRTHQRVVPQNVENKMNVPAGKAGVSVQTPPDVSGTKAPETPQIPGQRDLPVRKALPVQEKSERSESDRTRPSRGNHHWQRLQGIHNCFTHYESALKIVQKHGGAVALFLIESDNVRTHRFLTTLLKEGSPFRAKSYIPVVLDYAFGTLPADQYEYNIKLLNQFRLQNKLPAFILINSSGQILHRAERGQFYSHLGGYLKRSVSSSHSPSKSSSSLIPGKKRTIHVRLTECRKRLARLQQEKFSPWRNQKIAYVQQQISTLEEQQKIFLSYGKKVHYSAEKTAQFKFRAEKYLSTKSLNSGYTYRDIQEGRVLLKLLSDPLVDPNVTLKHRDSRGQEDPLLYLVCRGMLQPRKNFIDVLLKKNVDPNVEWKVYSRYHQPLLPFEILEKGAVNDLESKLPLFMVANNTISSYRSVGRKYAVKNLLSLLKLAPEINIARSGDAKTLMHLAAERSDRELAKTLLLAGFTLGKTKDARGMTPWRIAYRNADGDFMTFLQQHGLQTEIMPGDRVQHDFCKAIQRKEYFKLKSLLTQGADYREKQVDSLDMLQAACAKEDLALVKALLDAGVRPDRNADRKRSFYFVRNPLQIAVLKNNLKLFSLLLNYRMDPSIMVPYYLGGWVSLPFYIVHVHFDNKKIKSGRIIAFLEEMRRHSWEVNSVVPGEHYNNKPLLSSLLRYCEGNYRASKRLLDLVSYLLRIGAEVDPSEPAVQRLLRQNETSFKRRNRISNSSQQDRQKIGVLLRRAVLQNPVRNRP